jgi:transcriptional regulator with XRE-family HTH domain
MTRIKNALKEHKIIKRELAKKLDISENSLFYLIRREEKNTVETIKRISDKTEIPIDEFFNFQNYKQEIKNKELIIKEKEECIENLNTKISDYEQQIIVLKERDYYISEQLKQNIYNCPNCNHNLILNNNMKIYLASLNK